MEADQDKPLVYILMGPTASGKTAAAIHLVQHDPFDIISVDSALIYRDMNIGTAKPSAEELKIAPHRLIDIRDPAESYSVAEFQDDVLQEINNVIASGKIPLLVGGTMMYFRVLRTGLSDLPASDVSVRDEISREAEKQGWPFMHAVLKNVDPDSGQRIHPNDSQRIQRALSVYHTTGQTISALYQQMKKRTLPFRFITIALMPSDRQWLHQRIEKRFLAMLSSGFEEEVVSILKRPDIHKGLPSMRTVGYRQMVQHLNQEFDYEQMKEKAISASRQLAKRQMTWIRSEKNINIIDINQNNIIHMLKQIVTV